jgi:hypothetical protein
MLRSVLKFAVLPGSALLAACGLTVPQIGELWDDESGKPALNLEKEIKEKVYCELQNAVYHVNNEIDKILVDETDPKTGKLIKKFYPQLPEAWGVTLTLTLTVEELSALNPGVTFNTPIIPGTTYFPGKLSITNNAQAYNFGLGGTLSSDATRTDKFTFFYPVKDLEQVPSAQCKPLSDEPRYSLDTEHYQGSSLLLESDLGIKKWLVSATEVKNSIGNSAVNPSQVLSYDVKFEIVSSGNITPQWKLIRISANNGSAPFFNTKRDRTHEMLLTFGPVSSTKGKGGNQEPSTLASNDALAQQIGSAVGNAVKSALAAQGN